MSSLKALATALLFLSLSPSLSATIIINEIMQNPAAVSDSNGEWFELFNTSNTAIDINGWIVKDNDTNSHTIDNGGPLLIEASGFLLLGNNSDQATNGGIAIDYQYNGIVLGNAIDELILFNWLSLEIDRVEWDNGATFPDPNGASMALISTYSDNNNGINWRPSANAFSTSNLSTPGSCNLDVGQICRTVDSTIPEPTSFALMCIALLSLPLTSRKS